MRRVVQVRIERDDSKADEGEGPRSYNSRKESPYPSCLFT